MLKFIKIGVTAVVLIAVLQTMFATPVVAQDRSEEYQLKALLLSRLIGFVTWPMLADNAPLTLCVVGQNPFDDQLRQTFDGSRVKIEQLGNRYDLMGSCNIVFISDTEIRAFEPILDRLNGTGILTISDIPRFAAAGGMINMNFENRRVGFLINKAEADRVEINLSFQLLSLAEIVTTRDDRK